MSLLPKGENLRKAVKWISEERQAFPEKNINIIIDEASFRYDLSPKDTAFLQRQFGENNQ